MYEIFHMDVYYYNIISISKQVFLISLNSLIKTITSILILSSFLLSENISGTITDQSSGEPLPYTNIILLENSPLNIMERMIYYSLFAISCHSGFLVQISGANNSKIIDIINKKDFIWYSCWVPKNAFHRFVFKSNNRISFELKKILFDVYQIIKNQKVTK